MHATVRDSEYIEYISIPPKRTDLRYTAIPSGPEPGSDVKASILVLSLLCKTEAPGDSALRGEALEVADHVGKLDLEYDGEHLNSRHLHVRTIVWNSYV